MKLEKFIWNNGTKNNPIVLTDDEINTLLTLHKDYDIEFNVSGYITTSTNKIQKYLKYEIEQAYPNLIITAQVINDNITIGLRTTEINEGDSIVCYNKSIGLDLKYIRAKFTHKINITSGTIDEQSIIDSISYNHNNNLIVTQVPRFNSSWTDEVTVKFYPFYEDSSTNNAITYKFTVKAIAIENVNINLKDNYYIDAKLIKISFNYIPNNSTKINYITKNITINNNTYNETTGYKITKKETLDCKAVIKLFNNNILDLEKTINIIDRKIDIYMFDNRDLCLSVTKVTKYSIYDEDNIVLDDITNGITFWRGKYDKKSSKLKVKQVSTQDKSTYIDGTDITDYDDPYNTFTFVKYEGFAYKVEYDEDSDINCVGLHNILIYLTADITDLDNTWTIIPNNYFISAHYIAVDDKGMFFSRWKNDINNLSEISTGTYNNYSKIQNALDSLNKTYRLCNYNDFAWMLILHLCTNNIRLKERTNNYRTTNSNANLNDIDLTGQCDEYGNNTINTMYSYNGAMYYIDNFYGIEGFLSNDFILYNIVTNVVDSSSNINKSKVSINVNNKIYTFSTINYNSRVVFLQIKDNLLFPFYFRGKYTDENNEIKDDNDIVNFKKMYDSTAYSIGLGQRYDNSNDNYHNSVSIHNCASQWSMQSYLYMFATQVWGSSTKLTYTGEYEIIE